MEFFIFTTPIGLHSDYFPTRFTFNELQKIKENLINLRALFKKIYPSEDAIFINKASIIGVFANRNRCWTPYIRKHLFQKNSGYTGRHRIW
jgi:hypothetical protein